MFFTGSTAQGEIVIQYFAVLRHRQWLDSKCLLRPDDDRVPKHPAIFRSRSGTDRIFAYHPCLSIHPADEQWRLTRRSFTVAGELEDQESVIKHRKG